MDGPFAFTVTRGAGQSGRIVWGTRDQEIPIGEVDISAFLTSAVEAGKRVATQCRSLGWASGDLETLERVIVLSAS